MAQRGRIGARIPRMLVLAFVLVGLLARAMPVGAAAPIDVRTLFAAAICHDDAGTPAVPDRHDSCPLCPICQPPGHAALALPVSAPDVPPAPVEWARISFQPALARAPPGAGAPGYWPRGPPGLA